ncbi:MAG: macro domain-containing protein [Candidatus Muirbacterium halophilum]|nr:macro domain-containing protein [Candidatus Muirbacterium halophilum]MCK9475063.1 macro domain-containing protein [Candidatus Muirbacterium halophilum]
MIKYKAGDLLKEDVEAIVNTVNCVGIMGKGIALQFKKRFPDNYKMYSFECKQKKIVPGKMFVYETRNVFNPKFIINFPTKKHWKELSKLEYIENGLNDLVRIIKKFNITSIAIPPLGCGLGGLKWELVKKIIEEKLEKLVDVNIFVFEPIGSPEAKDMVKEKKIPNMTPGRAVLIVLINSYLAAFMDPFITLLEVQKLLYFLQESGEDLKLKYVKDFYGPYADNLRAVLNKMEGHYILGFADGKNKPDVQLELVDEAFKKASNFLSENESMKYNFNRVSELVEGFESPFGLELLSTVHWTVKKESYRDVDDVIEYIYNWNEHKKQFNERQIKLAYDVLKNKGWL